VVDGISREWGFIFVQIKGPFKGAGEMRTFDKYSNNFFSLTTTLNAFIFGMEHGTSLHV